VEFVHSITAGRAATGTATARQYPIGEVARPVLTSASTDPRATSTRRHEGGKVVWRVQCGDVVSRERCMTVFVEEDQVVLVGPPGETARLTASQLGQLRAALNEAAMLAER
jgi:hypothetical protein